MHQTEELSLSAQQARSFVGEGLDAELTAVRRFDTRERLFELAFFPALWIVSASFTLFVRQEVEPSWARISLSIAGVLVSAIALNAFVLLLHEGMHHTLFARPFWNRWVSFLLGIPLLMSFSAYQVMHLRHHTFLGDPRDPDDYANYTARPRILWLMHCLRLLVGAFLYLLFIPSLALRFGKREQRIRVLQEYALLLPVFAVVIVFVPGTMLLWGWFLPAILTAYMTNIRGFTQHGITDAHDPFLASRTMQPHPLVAFCLLNENYHLEHHLFPEVPSYHLPRLHRLLWPRLPRAVVGGSYLAFLARFLRATFRRDRTPIGLTIPAQTLAGSAAEPQTARESCRSLPG
jgi:fatty acid desaturase